MADREKSTRGRKRGPKGKVVKPARSANDLFDSLFQKEDEPQPKSKNKSLPLTKPKDTEVSSNSELFADSQSSGCANSNGHSSSDEEEPCVLISFASQEEETSPEASPAKRSRTRKSSTSPPPVEADRSETPIQAIETEEKPEEPAADVDDVSSQSDTANAERDSGVASLGVSKDVEDSIRAEIERMLANNRFRSANGDVEDDEEDLGNGHIALEQDIILVEPKSKKRCKFLIRQQEDQTPPTTRDYRCSRCAWCTTRMNNLIHHYKACTE